MSLQWTCVATILYVEMFICVLMMLPIISPQRWQKIFRSRLLNTFRSYANLYFNVFIGVLVLLLVDAIREMVKYGRLHEASLTSMVADMSRTSVDMKMFRAQRNFYISGMALVLWLVLRKLVTLISTQATLEANLQASQRQAESATAAAKQFIEDNDNKRNEKGDEAAQELSKTKQRLADVTSELTRAQKDLEAMKKQAQSTNNEYDRLTEEHAKLQNLVQKMQGDAQPKKDA